MGRGLRLRFWWDFYRKCIFRKYHIVSLAGVAYSLYDFFVQLESNSGWTIAWLFTCLGVLSIWIDLGNFVFSYHPYDAMQSDVQEDFRRITLPSEYASYTRKVFREVHHVAFSQEVNQLLANGAIAVEVDKAKFKLPEAVNSVIGFLLIEESKTRKKITNQRKVRLCTDLVPDKMRQSPSVRIQRTDYFDSLCTNENIDLRVVSTSTNNVVYTPLSAMLQGNRLLNLDVSECSNHIGTSVLAWSSDGYLILTVQRDGARVDSNRLLSTGSGSADWSDVRKAASLQQLVIASMGRELKQECKLPSASVPRHTHITGFARFLNRGGKPEFFGVTVVPIRKDELGISIPESVFISRHRWWNTGFDAASITSTLDTISDEQGHSFSADLHASALFLRDALKSDPKLIEDLAGRNC